jgi:hypothetical protein
MGHEDCHVPSVQEETHAFPAGRMFEWLACSHSRTSFMRALYQGCEGHDDQF